MLADVSSTNRSIGPSTSGEAAMHPVLPRRVAQCHGLHGGCRESRLAASVPPARPGRARRLPLGGSRQQPAHEVALQAEEHDQRDDDRDECRGRQQLPVLASRADQLRQSLGDGATSCVPPEKMRATSRSFHTQMNWKIANDASAGVASGSTMRKKICPCVAPSTFAASMTSAGISAMKLCSRKIASGRREHRVCEPERQVVLLGDDRDRRRAAMPASAAARSRRSAAAARATSAGG